VDGTYNVEEDVEVREKGGGRLNRLNENVKISEAMIVDLYSCCINTITITQSGLANPRKQGL